MNTKLRAYCEENGLSELTLDELVDCYITLRNINVKRGQQWNEELRNARELGEIQGRERVINGEYIEVSKLKEMTIRELVDFLSEP